MEPYKKILDTSVLRRESYEDAPGGVGQEVASVRSLSVEHGEAGRRATRTVTVDRALLEAHRVLAPGARGEAGLAYKMLRTQVMKRLDKLGGNTLAIVSPRAEDGKSVTASNLAVSVACDPTHTALLVELDLRRPSLAQRWGLQTDMGVDEHLRSRVPLERLMVRPEHYERLVLLPAHGAVEDSSELLLGRRTGEFVTELKSRYANRIVLFDLPPALETDETLALIQHVDAALVVVREGVTAREDVVRTIELLRDVPIVGTVLNASRDPAAKYSY